MDSSSGFRGIFSVDVEDWYHILDIPSAPAMSGWEKLPARVESNFRRLLDLFSERNVRVTCFFLGWIAERFPHLVREAAGRGHEIASHGYAHELVFRMTPQRFREDAAKSRKVLEDLSGAMVCGYRAPGFSSTEESPWFFEELVAAGYLYDSSIFPAVRGHGGIPQAPVEPYVVSLPTGKIVEFPLTVADCMGTRLCFFGGGYLRLFPYWLVRKMGEKVSASGRPVIFYVHPREIDPEQPRLPMSAARRFKSYVHLNGTQRKIERILQDFSCTTFAEHLKTYGMPKKDVAVNLAMPGIALEQTRRVQTSPGSAS